MGQAGIDEPFDRHHAKLYAVFFGKVATTAVDASSSADSVDREIELKLELDPAEVERLLEQLAPRGASAVPQTTVYYDTPAAVLRKHGFTLRVRQTRDRFVQTVKPTTDSAGLLSRAEYETEISSIDPDLAALSDSPLSHLVKDGQLDDLKAVTRSEVKRTSWVLEVGGSRIQADLDRGSIASHGHSQEFAELELELLSGDPACLLRAAKDVAERVPVRLGVLTKADRGALVGSGALRKIAKAAPVHVRDDMSIAEAFETILHACLKQYRRNEPLVLAKRKKDALHQARVAMRRLRSAFTLFKPAISDVEYQFLREELRWFSGQLGEARNLDVYLERELSDEDREALIVRRDQAYDHVLAAMDSQRFRLLLIELVGWAAFGTWRKTRNAAKPVEDYAAHRLNRLWSSIEHVGRHVADLDEETRHELRIQVKKMRYAIEFLRDLYPAATRAEKSFGGAVEDLQESLGKLNDLATARTLGVPQGDENWLIGSPDERPLIREAERAFNDLEGVGPFWREAHKADSGEA